MSECYGCNGVEGLGATFYSRGQPVPQYRPPWPERPGGMRPPWPERPGPRAMTTYNGVGAISKSTWEDIGWTVATVGGAASAYHGYKRNQSIGWAIGWAIFGTFMPFLAVPIALAQGFGKPASK
jgi:hypothetical protein